MHGLLIAIVSLIVEPGSSATWVSVVAAQGLIGCCSRALDLRLNSCDAQAQLLRSMWNLPGPGIKPMSPVLAVGFLSTATREVQFSTSVILFPHMEKKRDNK